MIQTDAVKRNRMEMLMWMINSSVQHSIGQGVLTTNGKSLPIHMYRLYNKLSFLEYRYNMHYVPDTKFFFVESVELDTNKVEGDKTTYDAYNFMGDDCDDVITALEDRFGMMIRD